MTPIDAWFERRGWTPFEFQREAWAAYLRGASGLIHAPTGLGKTQAAWFGPVREWLAGPEAPSAAGRRRRLMRGRAEPLRVLWITPLRALATDTVAALREPVAELGLPWTVELRTSDTPSSLRRRQKERLPTALVTTPESLSVLLSYPDARERVATLRAVVVDEWHELLGTKRGVQTELALARLRGLQPGLRVWGLSATLGNLGEARDVLLGRTGGELVSAPDAKQLVIETLIPGDIERFPWAGHLGMRLLPRVAEAIEAARATLLFTNTRSHAETWFQALVLHRPEWLGRLALHHGSLDRGLRQRVEAGLRSGALRCVVATSSLDLGVDFAPVDQIIQLGSPKGVARLLQRAGRSGHQPGATSRVLCVPTHAFELVEFAAARAAVGARQIEHRVPLRGALDVLVQHLVTVGAGGGFEERALFEEVRMTHAYRDLTRAQWEWTLDFVARGGRTLQAYPQYARLAHENGRYVVRTAALAAAHRLAIGTIASETSMFVRTVRGRRLGTIEESFIARLQPGERFVFAGRVLELIRVREMSAFVRPVRGGKGIVPRWYGGRFPLSTQLGAAVRRCLRAGVDGTDETPELVAVRPLLQLQAEWSRIPEPGDLLIEQVHTRDGHHVFCYPFEGRLVHEGLATVVAYRLTRARPLTITVSANDYGIELHTARALELDEPAWRALLTPEGLIADLRHCVNATELARRQFRDVARVAGLLNPGYPGQARSARQLQASSELFYEVFSEFDPDNLLLEQARREVLEQQLELARLAAALQRIAAARLVLVRCERLTPLAFPLWAEGLRAHALSSERWSARVQRMVLQLEHAAEAPQRKKRGSRTVSR